MLYNSLYESAYINFQEYNPPKTLDEQYNCIMWEYEYNNSIIESNILLEFSIKETISNFIENIKRLIGRFVDWIKEKFFSKNRSVKGAKAASSKEFDAWLKSLEKTAEKIKATNGALSASENIARSVIDIYQKSTPVNIKDAKELLKYCKSHKDNINTALNCLLDNGFGIDFSDDDAMSQRIQEEYYVNYKHNIVSRFNFDRVCKYLHSLKDVDEMLKNSNSMEIINNKIFSNQRYFDQQMQDNLKDYTDEEKCGILCNTMNNDFDRVYSYLFGASSHNIGRKTSIEDILKYLKFDSSKTYEFNDLISDKFVEDVINEFSDSKKYKSIIDSLEKIKQSTIKSIENLKKSYEKFDSDNEKNFATKIAQCLMNEYNRLFTSLISLTNKVLNAADIYHTFEVALDNCAQLGTGKGYNSYLKK